MTGFRAAAAAAVTGVMLLAAACGVSPEEEPQLIDQSTERPAATPSFDTETSPVPTTSQTTSPVSSPASSPASSPDDEVPPPSG